MNDDGVKWPIRAQLVDFRLYSALRNSIVCTIH